MLIMIEVFLKHCFRISARMPWCWPIPSVRILNRKQVFKSEHLLLLGKGNNLDIGAETLEFDIAAVLGRTVSRRKEQERGWEKEGAGAGAGDRVGVGAGAGVGVGAVAGEHPPLCVQAGRLRCELSYRRCETPIEEMLEMIKIEVGGYHQI